MSAIFCELAHSDLKKSLHYKKINRNFFLMEIAEADQNCLTRKIMRFLRVRDFSAHESIKGESRANCEKKNAPART